MRAPLAAWALPSGQATRRGSAGRSPATSFGRAPSAGEDGIGACGNGCACWQLGGLDSISRTSCIASTCLLTTTDLTCTSCKLCCRRFLLDTFGREKLAEGAGVLGGWAAAVWCFQAHRVAKRRGCQSSCCLSCVSPACLAADVAGGKGELAFELLNLNSVPATVLEPRPLELQRRVKWLLVRQ